ncbi:MAG: succinate dehydrogenase, hydrophobic membrane anchor protein [Candidatus Bathyarchaeia archaeon]
MRARGNFYREEIRMMRYFEKALLSGLGKMPVLSKYSSTRGWPFVMAWSNRIAGILLVLFLAFHILTLSSLSTPGLYQEKMNTLRFFLFIILEWALAIPVIYHSLNGGRIILYECYGVRKEESLIRWTLGLSILYAALLGILMIMGKETVSSSFFWLTVLFGGGIIGYGVFSRIWETGHSLSWRLQRITGAFLIIMIPAHLTFMHLNPSMGHDAVTVLKRMQEPFIRAIDIIILIAAIYHGGFGLISIVKDYISSRPLSACITGIVVIGMAILAIKGIWLTISV